MNMDLTTSNIATSKVYLCIYNRSIKRSSKIMVAFYAIMVPKTVLELDQIVRF